MFNKSKEQLAQIFTKETKLNLNFDARPSNMGFGHCVKLASDLSSAISTIKKGSLKEICISVNIIHSPDMTNFVKAIMNFLAKLLAADQPLMILDLNGIKIPANCHENICYIYKNLHLSLMLNTTLHTLRFPFIVSKPSEGQGIEYDLRKSINDYSAKIQVILERNKKLAATKDQSQWLLGLEAHILQQLKSALDQSKAVCGSRPRDLILPFMGPRHCNISHVPEWMEACHTLLQSLNSKIESSLTDMNILIKKLQETSSQQNSLTQELRKRLVQIESEYNELQKTLDVSQQEFQQNIKKLNDEIAKKEQQINDLKTQLADRDQHIELLQKQISQFREHIRQLEDEKNNLFQQLGEIQTACSALNKRVVQLEEEKKTLEMDLQDTRNVLGMHKEEIKSREDLIKDLRQQLANMQTTGTELQRKLHSTLSALDEANKGRLDKDNELARLEMKCDKHREEISKLAKEKERLELDLETARDQAIYLQNQLQDQIKQLKKKEQQFEEMKKEKTKAERQNKNFDEQVQFLQGQLVQKEEDTQKLREEISELQKKMEQLTELQEEKTRLKDLNAQQKQDIFYLSEQIKEMSITETEIVEEGAIPQDLNKYKAQFEEEIRSTQEKLNEELERLRTVYERLKNEHQKLEREAEGDLCSPEIQELQERLRKQEARMEKLAQEQLIKENKGRALETFRQEENLIHYYRTLLIKLQSIFISCKAIHGGFIEGRRGGLGAVSQIVNLLGEMVPLPGANLITNLAAFGLGELAETRLRNMANHISRLVTLQELEIVAEYTARKLTEWYTPLLRELADTDTFVQVREETDQTRIRRFKLLMKNIRKRAGQVVLRREPYLPAQQVAEFAILWLLDALCACEINWTPELDLGAEFVRIVTTHQKAGGLVQNFQKGLQNRLGLGTVLTRRGQNWNVGNIYTASGIQTQHGERWRVREVVPYGYCNGDSETARARGLICEGVIIEQGANDSGQINEDIRNCFSRNEVGNLENLLARTNYLDLSGLKLRKEQIQILTRVLRKGITIRTINLSNCDLNAARLHDLINALRGVRELDSLDLSNNRKLHFKDEADVMNLLSIPTLISVNLTNTGLKDKDKQIMGRDRRDVQYIITALERARHITFLGDIETNPRILNAHKTAIRALLNRNIAIRPEGVPMPKHQGSVGFFKCKNVDKFEQAITDDKVSAVTLLIEYGFNPMITFSNGNTELHKAVHANSQQVLKYLVNDYIQRGFKSRLEEKNDKGQTALDIAVEKNESDMVEFLKAALQTSQQQLVL